MTYGLVMTAPVDMILAPEDNHVIGSRAKNISDFVNLLEADLMSRHSKASVASVRESVARLKRQYKLL